MIDKILHGWTQSAGNDSEKISFVFLGLNNDIFSGKK